MHKTRWHKAPHTKHGVPTPKYTKRFPVPLEDPVKHNGGAQSAARRRVRRFGLKRKVG